ncbi:hypothetical protein OUZ56_019881 [Daphnia magna]|uniref:Uncharacterized protein n=1 Tax=Daphnia magna TaxID=35525 RepID=A0ABQ9ZDM6_9CRUS|nr:hypothetical protein OUZ56_019881 [Daphnia magna]
MNASDDVYNTAEDDSRQESFIASARVPLLLCSLGFCATVLQITPPFCWLLLSVSLGKDEKTNVDGLAGPPSVFPCIQRT